MKTKKDSVLYEKMVEGLDYTSKRDTKLSIKIEWIFDDFVIVKTISKTDGLITWKKIPRGKRLSGNREIIKSDQPFVMLFDTAMIALEKEVITFDEYGVLVAAANLIDWHDNRYVVDRVSGVKHTISSFSKSIHRRYETMLNTFKSLESKGFIKLESKGNATFILVNVDVAYKGKLDKITNTPPNTTGAKYGDKSHESPNINKGIAEQSQKPALHYHKSVNPVSQNCDNESETHRVMTEAEADFEYYNKLQVTPKRNGFGSKSELFTGYSEEE